MSGTALGADNSLYTQADGTFRVFGRPVVITVDGKASMMAAGTFQLVELEVVNDRLIKIFGNIVAIFDVDGYHNIIHRSLSRIRRQEPAEGYLDSRIARGGVEPAITL